MAFRAVSAPMLRSEPGTLLETVAGTITMGTHNSSYFPRAVNNSSRDRRPCRAEPRSLESVVGEGVGEWGYFDGRGAVMVERCHKEREKPPWSAPKEGSQVYHTG